MASSSESSPPPHPSRTSTPKPRENGDVESNDVLPSDVTRPSVEERLAPAISEREKERDRDRRSPRSLPLGEWSNGRRSPVSPRSRPRSRSPIVSRSSSPTVRKEEDERVHKSSPPNVTVIQPSVNHPMFSYLYHHGAMYPGATNLPLHMSHMLFSGLANHGAAGLPLHFPSSMSELSSLHNAASQHGLSQNMLLNGQLALGAGHPMWSQSYAAAFASQSAGHQDSLSHSLSHSSQLGSLFGHRPSAAGHRFTPYTLPVTKTTMVTSTPLASTGLHSPHTSEGRGPSPTVSSRSVHPHPHHGSPSPTRGSPQPAHTHSHSSSGAPTQNSVTSELKNIERMVNGLERQQEQLAAESLSKMTDK